MIRNIQDYLDIYKDKRYDTELTMSVTPNPAIGTVGNIEDGTALQAALGQGPGPSSSSDFVFNRSASQRPGSSKTRTFKQRFKHVLGPSVLGTGVTIVSNEDKKLCYRYDFGASYIPYNTTRSSVRPNELMRDLAWCNSYEIHYHQVTIDNAIFSRDAINPDGRIVTNWQGDTVEFFTDDINMFRPNNVVHIDKGKSLYDVNNTFRHVEPRTIQECTIPRAALQMSPEMYSACTEEDASDLQFGLIDPYHGLFHVETWHGEKPYSKRHLINSGRIPVGIFDDCTNLPFNQQQIRAANVLLDTVWGIQANMANQVNRSPIRPAPTMFMRMAPVFTGEGIVRRRAEFDCTYECSITFHKDPSLGTRFLHQGFQGKRNNTPFPDQFDQAAHDPTHYHPGVHAEDFVIPLTGYVINDTNVDTDLDQATTSAVPKRSTFQTHQNKVHTIMHDAGYVVTADTRSGVNVGTSISTPADDLLVNEIAPSFSEAFLQDIGFSTKDVSQIDTWVTEASHGKANVKGGKKYKRTATGLLTTDTDNPILPVSAQISLQHPEPTLSNFHGLRPGEAWHKLGDVGDLPRQTTRNGRFFVPWPRGVIVDKGTRTCSFESIANIAKLNSATLNKVKTINTILDLNEQGDVRIPLTDVLRSVEFQSTGLPLQTTALRVGPPMPITPQASGRHLESLALQNQPLSDLPSTSYIPTAKKRKITIPDYST